MKIKSILLTLLAIFVLANIETIAQNNIAKTGNATFYGNKWHGRRTSSGSIYHKDSLTCAHRTLPFGTLLKVTNKRNGKEVVVKVTDRGPFRKGAIVDLSTAAAKEIDMLGAGIVPVEIAMIDKMPTMTPEQIEPAFLQMEYIDPITGNYYTMQEWKQREQNRKELAKTNAAKRMENFTAKDIHYRVLNQHPTAKATKK